MFNQHMFDKHLSKACLAAVFALGLTACSSSDNGTDNAMPGGSMPTPQETCDAAGGRWNPDGTCTSAEDLAAEAERTAITNAIAAAKTAVDGLTAESSDVDLEAANAAVMAAAEAIEGAEHASSSDTVASLAALDAIRMSLTRAQSTIEDHRAELAKQRQAAIDASTKSAGTKLAAMNAEAAQTADAGLGGTDAPAAGAPGATTLAIGRDGTTVTISVQAGTSPDEDEDTTYTQAMDDLGGGRTMHELVGDADDDGNVETQIVIVSHDREAPKPVAFAKFLAEDGMMPQALNVRADGETVSDDDPADSRDLGGALLGTDDAAAAVLALVKSGSFTAGGTAAELTFGGDDPADDDDSAFTGSGTYNGATGTYMCNGGATDCTVTLDADGMITAMSDGWIFTPADGATSDQPDYDYLRYGFWLKKTANADGVVTYNEVQTFADAISIADSSGTVTGSASYSGGATGVYVHHVFTEGGGSIASSTAGHFSADASLKAYFNQPAPPNDNIPPNMLSTVTGTIDNFMLSGGETNDWSVALEGTIGLDGANDDFNGMAKGGVGAGSLSGNFYGDAGTLPAAATGEFNATMNNGSVAGAFGATMDEE